ncbi:hypothetical protein KA517_02710 [Candidatus Gracilibacteria bacterium]|jgi:hypothetical protein|nr:hypothetical protein [Candidatus Gracilibacteria bacterium]
MGSLYYLYSALLPAYPSGSGLISSQRIESVGVFYINIALSFLGLIALAVMIFGGVKMISAAGNGDQFKSGRGILVGAVIGFVLIIISFAVVTTLVTVFGTPGGAGALNGAPGVSVGTSISF